MSKPDYEEYDLAVIRVVKRLQAKGHTDEQVDNVIWRLWNHTAAPYLNAIQEAKEIAAA